MNMQEVMFQFEFSFIEMLSNLLASLRHLHCLTKLLHCNLIGTLKVRKKYMYFYNLAEKNSLLASILL